jgi:hypothetical protein
MSPTFKTKNKNIISQIKVNLKSNKKEKKIIISPKKTEKNSPRRNYQSINICKKTISPMKELNIRNSNRNSKLLRFNTGITISKKRGKNFIKNNNGNNTNIFLYKNVNVINKEKLKQIANNHRKKKACSVKIISYMIIFIMKTKKIIFIKERLPLFQDRIIAMQKVIPIRIIMIP